MSRDKRPNRLQTELASKPRNPVKWLRPTFLVSRTPPLTPVYLAVLSVDETKGEATYEILGCTAAPSTVSKETLANLLRTRGVKL